MNISSNPPYCDSSCHTGLAICSLSCFPLAPNEWKAGNKLWAISLCIPVVGAILLAIKTVFAWFLERCKSSKPIDEAPLYCGRSVSEVPAANSSEVVAVLETWSALAKEKYLMIHNKNYNDHADKYEERPAGIFYPRSADSPYDATLCKYLRNSKGDMIPMHTRSTAPADVGIKFTNLLHIIGLMKTQINRPSGVMLEHIHWDSFIISKKETTIDALALFSRQNKELVYIVTNPDNINHPINNEARTSGAGASIILYLAQEMVTSDSVLTLKSVREATPFYCKLHFELTHSGNGSECDSMILTAQKIRNLIDSRIPPFNQLSNITHFRG